MTALALFHITPQHAIASSLLVLASYVLVKLLERSRRTRYTTRLRGPPVTSFFWGNHKELRNVVDTTDLTDAWFETYGPVVEAGTPLGGSRILLADPKAIAQMYSQDTYAYAQTPTARRVIEQLVCVGLLHEYSLRFICNS
jgi:hypothetical protein